MSNITAVILAAGRGSRMKRLTDEKPKCLLELAGKPLLYWQIDSLQKAGIDNIVVVRGYRGDLLQGEFKTIDNENWASSNMVRSLLCAFTELADSTILVSYSDIVYKSEHVQKLIKCQDDICLTYDLDWEKLWNLRQDGNPLEDAETFKEENRYLLEIGGKPESINDVQGQYMGLLKFSPKGQLLVKNCIKYLDKDKVDNLDITSMLKIMLKQNIKIGVISVSGGWCECDTEKDIKYYEKMIISGNWSHDWR